MDNMDRLYRRYHVQKYILNNIYKRSYYSYSHNFGDYVTHLLITEQLFSTDRLQRCDFKQESILQTVCTKVGDYTS